MNRLLWLSLLRHLLRHPWQLGLAILGIALGVAVVLAVDIANSSALRSFELANQQLTGSASHRIVASSEAGVPEQVYVHLRRQGIRSIAPVVMGYAEALEPPGKRYQLLGIDPFAEGPFRPHLDARETEVASIDLLALLTEPDTAVLPGDVADPTALSLQIGADTLTLRAVGQLTDPSLHGLVLMDIATAQTLLDRVGWLSHIDVRLPEGEAGERLLTQLQSALPESLHLVDTAEQAAATAELSASFGLNLTALSLLALLVGMFLIYNTMTFVVVQRRGLLGMLRALGVTRSEIIRGILGEALLLGLIGTLLGGVLGVWLGSVLLHLVTQTIDDLYYVLTVTRLELSPLTLAKAAALGLFASVLAALLPAREAAMATPGAAISRVQLETQWRALLPLVSACGIALLLFSAALFWLTTSLVAALLATFALLIGCALLTPLAVVGLTALTDQLPWGLLPRMALRGVVRHLSRTGVAVAALMVAFATTVGIGVMVDSFRSGVIVWLQDVLTADVYITPVAAGSVDINLDSAVLARLPDIPGVAAVTTARWRTLDLEGRPVQLGALDIPDQAPLGYRLRHGEAQPVQQALQAGAILVSEPLAYRRNLAPGDTLTLPVADGTRAFTIAGVFYDYGSEHGRIIIQQAVYRDYWRDLAIDSAGVYLAEGYDLDTVRRNLEQELGALQAIRIWSNRAIFDLTLEIFERTFTITRVLQLLAIIVAGVGLLSALLAQLLERTREFSLLRALGMTPAQLGILLTLQSSFLGLVAGVLALPVGLLVASVLVFVINRRAFGWTLPFEPDPNLLWQTVALALSAALLAVVLPAWRLWRQPPAAGLRTE
jgi:putative ABC transport system permease protein